MVVFLYMGAGYVAALGLIVTHLIHEDSRAVWQTLHFSQVSPDLLDLACVGLILGVVLIQNDYSESLGMSCQSDKRFQCRGELWITI